MLTFDEFVRAVECTTGRQGRRVGRQTRLLCPAHDDHNPSLDVSKGDDGRPLVACRSHGCSFEDVCRAIGRDPSEFNGRDAGGEWTPAGPAVAVYDYTDEYGTLLFQVCRTADKKFSQRRPDPATKSGWRWSLGGVRRVLYRLPEVVTAVEDGQAVYVCEGEKDVETLRRVRVVATCNPGGAGKWRDDYVEVLRGAEVVIVADRDDAGVKHARRVTAALAGVASSVAVVQPARGKDVTDHIEAGLALEQLEPLEAGGEEPSPPPRGKTQAAATLVALMGETELFHTSVEQPFVTFVVQRHRETWPLRSKRFKTWLSSKFWERDGKIPSSNARNDALTVLEGLALHGSPRRDVHVRVGGDDVAIYLDLGNDDWEIVRIDRDGWRIDRAAPVRFRRSGGMLPLPRPERGGSVDDLRPFVNVDDEGWILFASWLVSCLRPQGPFPVLDLLGEQGAAKSTSARVARSLVDPHRAALQTAPRELRDFMVTTTNSWVVALDNLSGLPPWLSDALCRLSTGGGLLVRELYTDADEVIFDAQRPVVLTGITELATRSDLLDRALMIALPRIQDEDRLPEEVFWDRFDRVKPRILGALLGRSRGRDHRRVPAALGVGC